MLVIISSKPSHFKRIDDNLSGVVKHEEKLRVKANICKQYYDILPNEILLLSKDNDAHEPFSSVSPISVSKLDKKAGILKGYWLYDHCDNAYFASLDQVHLYDDDGNVVADITFKEKMQNG